MMMTASTIASMPPLVQTTGNCQGTIKCPGTHPVELSMQFLPLDAKLARLGPMGIHKQLLPIDRRRPIMHPIQKQFASVICTAALNARCSSEQTQTVLRESPTITSIPGKEKEKSPLLDDGGSGLPPRDDGDGGGGGGGGGGNWSGGFFLFGFLAFLGFLKDKESEEDYRDSRRR